MTVSDALLLALGHHNAGRLQDAEQAYRQILAKNPAEPSTLYLLGRLTAQTGRLEESAQLLALSIAAQPSHALTHAVLGEVYELLNQPQDAIVSYQTAISLDPGLLDVRIRLGHVLQRVGMFDEALASYEYVLSRQPDSAMMHANVAEVLRQKGLLNDAEQHARQAVLLDPNFAGGYCNLGLILHTAGRYAEAVPQHEAALKLDPNMVWAWNNLGLSLSALKRHEDGVRAYERALAICPRNESSVFRMNMGTALLSMGRLDDAVVAFREALVIDPSLAEALGNLGNALREQGLHADAVACYRQAVALAPHSPTAHSNLLFPLNADPGLSARQILHEHRTWAKRYADPLTSAAPPHRNTRDADRRLRIGYVSPDFRDHPLGRFLLPLLEHHDRKAFEVVCYSGVYERDDLAPRFLAAADRWRDVASLTDAQLADQIRDDQIDVLVDLTLHASGTRLMAFARKPAPVQITYLSYAGTSGMSAMDYRISDPHLDPPCGDADRPGEAYSENTLRLPRSYWCYEPHAAAPTQVGPLPLRDKGHVTFGCLNYFGKASDVALDAWSRVLVASPHSKLLLHSLPGSHRERVAARFSKSGVDPSRVQFVGKQPVGEYFAAYNNIDVALDPFPYAGGTTTCDALWMGVPVITLRGKTAVGRAGASILTNAGLAELIADDVDRYVALATELADDADRLSELRRSMRERLRASALMDAPSCTRDVENAFRTAWRSWCSGAITSQLG